METLEVVWTWIPIRGSCQCAIWPLDASEAAKIRQKESKTYSLDGSSQEAESRTLENELGEQNI